MHKSSVKPFLENYKGKFSNKIGQNLNMLEYLVYKKYENFIKCKFANITRMHAGWIEANTNQRLKWITEMDLYWHHNR